MRRKPLFIQGDYSILIDRFKKGVSERDIAREFMVSDGTMRNYKYSLVKQGLLTQQEAHLKRRGRPFSSVDNSSPFHGPLPEHNSRYLEAWRMRDALVLEELSDKIEPSSLLEFLSGSEKKEYEIYLGLQEQKTFSCIRETTKVSKSTISIRNKMYISKGFFALNQKRKMEMRKNPYGDGFWEEVLSFQYSTSELAERCDLTRAGISKRFTNQGITTQDYNGAKKKQEKELQSYQQRLLSLILQYSFEKIQQEQGLNMALAWRCRDVYSWGTTYSIETLEKLIAARREGNGYFRCVKSAGLAESVEEVRKLTSRMSKVLERALHDIPFDIQNKNFGEGRKLSLEEEEELKRMYTEGRTNTEIEQTLQLLSPTSYYVKKFHLPRRKQRIEYTALDDLIKKGYTTKEIMDQGFKKSTINKRNILS